VDHKKRILAGLFDFIRDSFLATCFCAKQSEFGHPGYAKLHRAGLGVAAAAAMILSGCIESRIPLLTDAHPLIGQEFEVHLYEDFADGKANNFHASSYRWKDGQYVRASGLARDVKSFVVQSMTATDYIIQATNESEKVFHYWIGRKIADGVYIIFAPNEADVDDVIRAAACAKGQPAEICQIQTFDQLTMFARATSAKPVRNPALGVILAR
jgi:hypothetical protein